MSGQVPGDASPLGLLDSYLTLAGDTRSVAFAAIRTLSLAARQILAHAVTRELSLDQLVAAARDRATNRLSEDSASMWALVNLARTVALQELLPEDRSDGIALYDLALELFGADRIPRFHQGLHAQLAFRSGDHRRTGALLDGYSSMSDEVRSYLALDLLNPFRDGAATDATAWLSQFWRLLPEPALELTGDHTMVPFDRLTATDRKRGGERISVVVTSFKPGPGLATAVRSLIAQSWTDLEILIVDDGSPPDYDPVLKDCLALDERIKLVKLATNAGTYVARNAGLDAASGAFVTFQDSDDWSHPRRLEHQVEPLLRMPSLVATVSDGLRVRDDLIVTHTPGRDPYAVVPSSLMLRKHTVLDRIGYFDSVRREADSEYLGRLQAAFGAAAIERLREIYSLIRLTPNSLSRTDIRAGWIHPARLAYKSAYRLWHEQISAGETTPGIPKSPAHRRFAAPAYIRGETPSGRRADILFAGDWRRTDGLSRSTRDEIGALLRRGRRVGVLQIESFRFTPERNLPLCRPIQELINDGTVVQAFVAEEFEADLVLVQCPSVLQFAADEPSQIMTRQVVIRTSRAPSGPDGEDFRYLPRDGTSTAKQLFSVDPLWCPSDPTIRAHLEPQLMPSELVGFDLPGVVDVPKWRVNRGRFRSGLPVIGKHLVDGPVALPADRETLLQVYPDSPDADVRFMGGHGTLKKLLGTDRFPVNWLVYRLDETPVRSFLNQVDFYLHFPPPSAAETLSRAVLEALASGCVVILPHRLSSLFGDAALYRDPAEVWPTIQRYHSEPECYLDQSRRAQEWMRRHQGEDAYARLVSDLMQEV